MIGGRKFTSALWTGIAAHWLLRWPSWVMSAVLFGIGVMLFLNPHIFTHDVKAYQYIYLNEIINQRFWAFCCTGIGAMRLAALIINGTIPTFIWSPHVRAAGSAISCFIWLQIFLATLAMCLVDSWNTAMPIYAGMLVVDIMNTYIAALEIESGEAT
jgi:hypothetical protein